MAHVLVAAATLAAGLSVSAAAQTSPCRVHADTAGLLVARVKIAYGAMDSTALASQGDPYARPAAITLVTDSTTCAQGVSAYNGTQGGSGAGAVTSAYVIALGTSGYIVVNPADKTGHFSMMYIFTSNWQFRKAVAG